MRVVEFQRVGISANSAGRGRRGGFCPEAAERRVEPCAALGSRMEFTCQRPEGIMRPPGPQAGRSGPESVERLIRRGNFVRATFEFRGLPANGGACGGRSRFHHNEHDEGTTGTTGPVGRRRPPGRSPWIEGGPDGPREVNRAGCRRVRRDFVVAVVMKPPSPIQAPGRRLRPSTMLRCAPHGPPPHASRGEETCQPFNALPATTAEEPNFARRRSMAVSVLRARASELSNRAEGASAASATSAMPMPIRR